MSERDTADQPTTDARKTAEPETTALSEARCPKCGSEDGIERINHPRLPPEKRGRCTACDHRAEPLAFHHSWQWKRMSADEREQARDAELGGERR
jgi:hypothetical protein